MSTHFISTSLETISTDQLPGVIAVSTLLCLACRKIIARSSNVIPSHIGEAAEAACQRLGNAQVPQLLLSGEVPVPFTAGTLRPVIVLPKSAIEWSREKLQMVIAHELAHIERHDVLWHWIGRLAICVAWFNPLVWWAARRGVLDRERACDDRVIGCGFRGPDYGQCLVEIAAAVSGRIMPVTAAVSMAEPPMKLRLQTLTLHATIELHALFVGDARCPDPTLTGCRNNRPRQHGFEQDADRDTGDVFRERPSDERDDRERLRSPS